jgi:Domain of unknown function (DUF5666)
MRRMKLLLLTILLAGLIGGCAAQTAPATPESNPPSGRESGGREAGRRPGLIGKITAINGQIVTMKSQDGHDVTVTLTDSTRFMKDRQPAKLTDFKVGDMAMVRGHSTGTDAWEAEVLATRTGGTGDMAEGLGKKFIVGEIKAIDGTNLTIVRPDGQTQTIAVDENTSFHKQGESITLADFKVGDHVFGRGEMKGETFVAKDLMAGDPPWMGTGPTSGDRKPK